jgi:cytochrome P450
MPQLKAELGIVLGAGFETTSHAITWTLASVATHPRVQVRLKNCTSNTIPSVCLVWCVIYNNTLAATRHSNSLFPIASCCFLLLPAVTTRCAPLPRLPVLQAKLAAELSAAGLTDRQFDWGDLGRFPYLNAVIKESLRLFSPASMGTSRVADKDMTICGHTVPKVSWSLGS